MKSLICLINMFTYDHKVFVMENGKVKGLGKINIEEGAKQIIQFAIDNDVDDIRLSSAPSQFSKAFIEQIRKENIKSYSKKMFNIEVL